MNYFSNLPRFPDEELSLFPKVSLFSEKIQDPSRENILDVHPDYYHRGSETSHEPLDSRTRVLTHTTRGFIVSGPRPVNSGLGYRESTSFHNQDLKIEKTFVN